MSSKRRIEVPVGTKFGEWTVLGEAEDRIQPSGKNIRMILCRCSCGIEKTILLGALRNKTSKICSKCAMKKRQAIINVGDLFNKWTIISEIEPYVRSNGTKSRMFLCRCECGNECNVRIDSLLGVGKGLCKKCSDKNSGKLRTKYNTDDEKRLSVVLYGMKQRCYNKNHGGYKNYGGRGITVCDEWSNNYLTFVKWSIDNGYKKGLQIDRTDNDKGYSPENCRFVTPHVNVCNRRKIPNKSGYTGVQWHRTDGYYTGGYSSDLAVKGESIYLGIFDKPEDACKERNDYIIENGLTEYKIQKLYGSRWEEKIEYFEGNMFDEGKWVKDETLKYGSDEEYFLF